jgi:hypothetical protein
MEFLPVFRYFFNVFRYYSGENEFSRLTSLRSALIGAAQRKHVVGALKRSKAVRFFHSMSHATGTLPVAREVPGTSRNGDFALAVRLHSGIPGFLFMMERQSQDFGNQPNQKNANIQN